MKTTKLYTIAVPVRDWSDRTPDPLVPTASLAVALRPEDGKALALAYLLDKPALLVGETGTGKTSAIRHLAEKTGSPYVRVNMSGFTTPDELIGSKSVKDGATYYERGIITDAMARGAVLVLDEINATTPDCLFILHGLLDEDRRITMPNGEVLTPAEGFRVFATCNPDYEGTKTINKALLDRFPIIISVDTLTPAKERALLVDRTGIDETQAINLIQVAHKLREAYRDGKTGIYTSTRALLNVAELVRAGMELSQAFTTTVARKAMGKDEQQYIADTFAAVLKMEVSRPKDSKIIILDSQEYEALLTVKVEAEKRIEHAENMARIAGENAIAMEKRLEELRNGKKK